ncbi:MAG: DUF1249 domain-containing protein [Candidatus Malihini olakiniferum]
MLVAEASASQQIYFFKAHYAYSNKKLCQLNKKHQTNQFFAD